MNTVQTDSGNALQLDWSDEDGVVTVTPRDQQRFLIKVRKAIDVLRQSNAAEQWTKQFDLLVRRLAEWLNARQDVANAYVTLRDGAVAFVVIRNECRYDDEFEDALSELDLALANDLDLDLIKLNSIALPPVSMEALDTFVDSNVVLSLCPAPKRT